MAITSCPECNKKISSKSVICAHCGIQLGVACVVDLEFFRARKLRERIFRLYMRRFLVITIFVAAFGWYWYASRGFTEPSQPSPFILMGISAVAYLIVRGFLFQARHQRRAMRQKHQMSNDLRRNL